MQKGRIDETHACTRHIPAFAVATENRERKRSLSRTANSFHATDTSNVHSQIFGTWYMKILINTMF